MSPQLASAKTPLAINTTGKSHIKTRFLIAHLNIYVSSTPGGLHGELIN